jgi:hypothetical protein
LDTSGIPPGHREHFQTLGFTLSVPWTQDGLVFGIFHGFPHDGCRDNGPYVFVGPAEGEPHAT